MNHAGTTQDQRQIVPAIAADGSLFKADKLEVHRTGQKHLAVSVFVFHGSRLLIQRRAAVKYHCAGLWANTCCSHPAWGETPADCASRRLVEEVGLSVPLNFRAIVDYRADVTGGMIENERVHIFEGSVGSAILPNHNPDEVAELRWIDRAELARMIARHPEIFTPWLRIYVARWSELALQAAA